MRTFLIRIAAITAIIFPMAAVAQQQINIFWFEDASCAAWSKSAGNRLIRAQYEFWIRGFASGHNYANPTRQIATGKLPGGDQLYAYLDEYCLDNPNSSFAGGAIRLIEKLRESAVPPKPAATPAKKETLKPGAVK